MYLIHKHTIDVNCSKKQLGHEFKNDLSSVLQADFYPKLEKLLMSYNHQNILWQIEDLPILIDDGIDVKNWKTEIVEKSLDKIKQFLDANKPTQGLNDHLNSSNAMVQEKRTAKHVHNLLVTYLKTGVLKDNAIVTSLEQLYDHFEMDLQFMKELENTLKNKFYFILRWSFNIPLNIKKQYLKLKNISHKLDFSKGLKEKDTPRADFLEYLFWESIFNKNPNVIEDSAINELKKIADRYYNIEEKQFDKILLLRSKQEVILSSAKESKPIEIEDVPIILTDNQETYYINNAGLVLLHPFLPKLFSSLKYLVDGDWKDVKTQHRAVLSLQYLTNFQEVIFENDLLLNKLLCGVAITDTINTTWEITKKEKKVCQELLNAVIKHWKILKNTSIGTLQETFLRREAKMEMNRNEQFEITVAQQSIDLLFDQLPWSIGMIKTPWMKDYLTCNWR